ncbi:MAG: hypothetical protein ACREAC_14485, partial [Blastocatellia bacterium]
YICVDCQAKPNPRGLLPGAAWTNASGAWGTQGAQENAVRRLSGPLSGRHPSEPGSQLPTDSAGSVPDLADGQSVGQPSFDDTTPTGQSQFGDLNQGFRRQGDSRGDDGQAGDGRADGGDGLRNSGPVSNGDGAGDVGHSLGVRPAPDAYGVYAQQYWPYPPPEALQPDPDNPPWRLPGAFGAWMFSVAAIIVTPSIGVFLFIFYEKAMGANVPLYDRGELERYLQGPSVVLSEVLSTVVAHLLTILMVWAVVTRLGRKPFFETLGFRWEGTESLRRVSLGAGVLVLLGMEALVWTSAFQGLRDSGKVHRADFIGAVIFLLLFHAVVAFGVWATITGMGRKPLLQTIVNKWNELVWLQKLSFVLGTIVGMIAIEIILGSILPESHETDFEKIIKTSQSVRIAVAAMAVLTAPIVEEGVYRG